MGIVESKGESCDPEDYTVDLEPVRKRKRVADDAHVDVDTKVGLKLDRLLEQHGDEVIEVVRKWAKHARDVHDNNNLFSNDVFAAILAPESAQTPQRQLLVTARVTKVIANGVVVMITPQQIKDIDLPWPDIYKFVTKCGARLHTRTPSCAMQMLCACVGVDMTYDFSARMWRIERTERAEDALKTLPRETIAHLNE